MDAIHHYLPHFRTTAETFRTTADALRTTFRTSALLRTAECTNGPPYICVCAARQPARSRARTAPGRTKTRIKARDCTHSQTRMEVRSTDRSGTAGGVYTRHRRVPLAWCEKDVYSYYPARGNTCACAFLVKEVCRGRATR